MKLNYIKPVCNLEARRTENYIDDMEMPVDKFADWHRAIIGDDLDFFTLTLETYSQTERDRCLNGYFVSVEDDSERIIKKHFKRDSLIKCQKPLALAFIFGSRKLLKVMLENGADPLGTESNQGTILHSIIAVASLYPELEKGLAETYPYFIGLLSSEERKQLLFSENDLGLRPLEYAAHRGCVSLVRAIFQTPKLYLVKEAIYGMWLYQWYDITDYESFSPTTRRGKSPLAFLTFMTNSTIHRDGIEDLLYWKPFRHWYRIKLFSNLPWLLLWATYRVMFCLVVMIIMVDKGNIYEQGGVPADEAHLYPNATFYYCSGYTTVIFGKPGLVAVAVIACINSCVTVIFDIGEIFFIAMTRRPEFLFLQVRTASMAISFWFHRVSQFLFVVSVLVFTSRIAQADPVPVDTVSDVGRLFVICTAFASLLFFFEQIPQVGFYIIAIKRMLKDLFYFWILYTICVAPFVLYFMVFMNTNSTQGCIPEFDSYIRSSYSMFLVMLNMMNFTKFEVNNSLVLYTTHMVFIFVVSILLVNFLIAVMTDSAVRMSRHKKRLIRLELLHALYVVNVRIDWLLKRYYNYMIQKLAFVQEGRIFLLNVQQIAKRDDK
ncbi:hypothetical protein LSH36_89g00026 [Paralvinella palmiformis]|uniref:Ion transport domain-containing protein n=1 Tax=Paralvinella palmiformis TaxID=53620 RepID=A0AAD9K220_9ANNE|nr:hypothetical protein LSH36_89g00026 [Paralvinella palmiformis]